MNSTLSIDYLAPKRIVAFEGDITNESSLLKEKDLQIHLQEDDCMTVKGKGFIVLDFGKEIRGGARILVNLGMREYTMYPLRLRFGESVSETYADIGFKNATNNHSPRDFSIEVPALSDTEWGDTGYRFLRIDFLDEDATMMVKSIYAKSIHHSHPMIGSFKCDDDRINEIFDTAARTVSLNLSDHIWDGIKRDRLVWIGDMEPEVHAILSLFGDVEAIKRSIEETERHCHLPGWMDGIPSYSLWYLEIINVIYKHTGNKGFLSRRLPFMKPLLSQLNEAITDNGEIDYTAVKGAPSGCYFIDWPSSEEPIEDQKEANRCLYAYVYGHLIETLEAIGEDVSSLKEIHSKILSHVGKAPKKKQLAAFQHLVFSNQESYEKLTEGKPEEGYSTFMSYYIASAIFKCDSEASLLGLKKYYSSMIDRGATTFFEDFSIDWLEGSSRIDELPKEGEKDLHGDYGSFCYKGFRHSLCHGWSAGPVQFLFEKIAGIETLDSDHIVISPSLCWLNKIDLTYPTKHGPLKVSIKKANGKPIIEYEAPRGLNVSIN